VGIALCLLVEEEELSKVVEGEVSFRRFGAVVDDASGEGLLVGLSLEDFLLDGSLINEDSDISSRRCGRMKG